VRFHPLLKELFPVQVTVYTRYAVVGFDMTAGTDARQTRWALQDSVRRRRPIDLRAVRARTIMKFVGTGIDITEERGIDHTVKVISGKDVPGDMNRNKLRASGFITQAYEREDLVVDCSDKVVRKALSAPTMPAPKLYR